MTFFYKELDFPPVPEELIAQVKFSVGRATNDSGYGIEHYQHGKKLTPCGYTFGRVINNDVVNWLQANIPPISNHLSNPRATTKGKQIYVQSQSHYGSSEFSTHIVHSDYKRLAALNYHWARGGDSVVTRWYQDRGKSLWKNKQKPSDLQSDDGQTVYYDNLEILEEVEIKPHRWYLINTAILHDVQNLTSNREGFTVCFLNEKELAHAGFDDYPHRPRPMLKHNHFGD